jgi:hypothetical protein
MERWEYWCEAVACGFDEADAFGAWDALTREQKKHIGKVLEGAAETQDMTFYVPENPDRLEIERLSAELKRERGKVGCFTCRGTGRIQGRAGPWFTDTQCDDCRGEGKVAG